MRRAGESAIPALRSESEAQEPPEPAELVAPPDGTYPLPLPGQRFGDFVWTPSPSRKVVAEIAEFAYVRGDPAYQDARLFVFPRSRVGPVVDRVSAGQLWTTRDVWEWRVWSIRDDGVITFSDARFFNH